MINKPVTAFECMVVDEKQPFTEVLRRFALYDRIRTILVTAPGGKLSGIMTRGDLRRVFDAGNDKPYQMMAGELCNTSPRFILDSFDLNKAREMHEDGGDGVWDIPVLDENNRLAGLVWLHNGYEAEGIHFVFDEKAGTLSQMPPILFVE